MSKYIPPALNAHLQLENTNLCTCWKIIRTDGAKYGFTEHDADLKIDGIFYRSATAYTPTSISTSAKLDVDNLDVMGLLDDTSITEADLLNGLWDYANIEIFQVNYRDLSMGKINQRKGWLGEVKINKHHFVAELRGMMQALQQTIGELYSPGCRANLGDARCKKNLTTFTFIDAVTSVASKRNFISTGLTQAAEYFTGGVITWVTGDNAGLQMEIKTFSGGAVVLQMPMPYDISITDTFSIVAGCQKRLIEDCKTKFKNVINFRGEPYVPGFDQVIKGPSR